MGDGVHQRKYRRRSATCRPSSERNAAARRVRWAVEP